MYTKSIFILKKHKIYIDGIQTVYYTKIKGSTQNENIKRGDYMGDTKKLIKAYSALKGLTQEDLAKKLNITRAAFNRKLNGKSEFYDREKKILAELFGVKITDIFFTSTVHGLKTNI